MAVSTTVTLTADDGNGNTASCDFEVILIDTEAPTIECPSDQEVSLDANCEFELPDYTVLATLGDNCSTVIDVTQAFPSSTGGGLDGWPGSVITETETIELTATDESGNSTICQFEVIPTDDTPPVATCKPRS